TCLATPVFPQPQVADRPEVRVEVCHAVEVQQTGILQFNPEPPAFRITSLEPGETAQVLETGVQAQAEPIKAFLKLQQQEFQDLVRLLDPAVRRLTAQGGT